MTSVVNINKFLLVPSLYWLKKLPIYHRRTHTLKSMFWSHISQPPLFHECLYNTLSLYRQFGIGNNRFRCDLCQLFFIYSIVFGVIASNLAFSLMFSYFVFFRAEAWICTKYTIVCLHRYLCSSVVYALGFTPISASDK